MIIERIDEDFYKYAVSYEQSDVPICKFKSLRLAVLFVRYMAKCRLSEIDEFHLAEAIRKYDKATGNA